MPAMLTMNSSLAPETAETELQISTEDGLGQRGRQPAEPTSLQKNDLARERHHNLLQLACALAIIAFHVGVRGASTGWIAVELFFVLAGYRMYGSLARSPNTLQYLAARVRRLAPELGVLWLICGIGLIIGWNPHNLWLFFGSTPFFSQNLVESFWTFDSDVNWTFLTAMWFVAALLQLQLLFVLLRRILFRCPVALLLSASLVGGVLFRLGFASYLGPHLLQRDLSLSHGYVLYVMPFTHLEAITLGFVLGRGAWRQRPGLFWVALCAVLGLGTLNFAFADGTMPLTSFGFPSAMRFNYQYVWGYSILALLAALICAPGSPAARQVQSLKLPGCVDHALGKLASLTYGAYVFHGLALTFLWPNHPKSTPWKVGITLITVVTAFSCAWLFQTARMYVAETRLRRRLKRWQTK